MKPLLGLLMGMLLLGCDGMFEMKVKDICAAEPSMCSDLNTDGWCRFEKSKIIKTRYARQLAAEEKQQYDLLTGFEAYKKCVSKAAQIQHIKLKEKQTDRVKGLLTAERELIRLARETRASKEPHLLYYHWSRFGNEDALEGFLAYRDQGVLETPELQVALASYYIKTDLKKAEETLLHAAELHKPDEEIDPEIIRGLLSIYIKNEAYKKAYMWAYIGRELEVKDIDITQIEAVLAQNNTNLKRLRKKAETKLDALEEGTFSRFM